IERARGVSLRGLVRTRRRGDHRCPDARNVGRRTCAAGARGAAGTANRAAHGETGRDRVRGGLRRGPAAETCQLRPVKPGAGRPLRPTPGAAVATIAPALNSSPLDYPTEGRDASSATRRTSRSPPLRRQPLTVTWIPHKINVETTSRGGVMFNVQSRNALAVAAVAVLVGSGCASSGAGTAPRSPAQMKQQELMQMEKQGQRNDFDKPFQ